jgi:hypothetical protein
MNVKEATQAVKTQETRVRRMAERQGFRLKKSRRRDELAKDYGLYWVLDPDTFDALGGWPEGAPPPGFPWNGLSLTETEQWLRVPPVDR